MGIEVLDSTGALKESAVTGYTEVTNTDTGTQNDWSVIGSSQRVYIQWSGASDMTVTGLAGGTTGADVIFKNVGAAVAYFSTNDAGSSAANRLQNFLPNGKLTPVAPGGSIRWIFGADWDVVAHFQGNEIAYTPTWTATAGTAPAIGNGTLTGAYTVRGRMVFYTINLTGGSTTTWGDAGLWTFSVPYAFSSNAVGIGLANDVGVQFYASHVVFATASTVAAFLSDAAATFWTFNGPFAWGTSDTGILNGEYPA